MKSTFILLLALIATISAGAQKTGQTDFELGVSGGVSWYNGDLNPDKHFSGDYLNNAFGISLRKNLSERFALRLQGNYGRLSANDALSGSQFQQNRNLNFSTRLIEVATTFEFNFLEFDALIRRKSFSPFIFIGIAGFHFNPETEVEGNQYELRPLETENKSYSRYTVSMPFGFGFKWAVTDRLILSADWGLRKTWTDYIDDVSTYYPAQADLSGLSQDLADRSLEQVGPDGTNWNTQRGTSRTEDWYSFAMLTVSMRLGPKKGSCKHLRN